MHMWKSALCSVPRPRSFKPQTKPILPLAESLEERFLLSGSPTFDEYGVFDLAGVSAEFDSVEVLAGQSIINSGGYAELTTTDLTVNGGSIDIGYSLLRVTGTGLITGTFEAPGTVAADQIVIDGTVAMQDSASLTPFFLTISAGGTLNVTGLTGGYVMPDFSTLDAAGTVSGSFSTGFGTWMTIGGAEPATFHAGDLALGPWSDNWFDFTEAGYDQIVVTGSVALDGMFTIGLADNGLTGPFVIIENNGIYPVSGAFEGLPNIEGGSTVMIGDQAFQLFYTYDSATGSLTDGNDVALVIPGLPPEGEPPVAVNDDVQGQMNTPLVIDAETLLANDYDPDGTAVQIVSVAPADTHGTVVLNEDGTITYTPEADWFGVATFEYTIADADDMTGSAFVYVDVQPPAQLSGWVFLDFNNDGVLDPNETPLSGVVITLTGLSDAGEAVWDVQYTDADGAYSFTGLSAGVYQIAQTQPGDLIDGIDTIGSLGGVVGPDVFTDIRVESGQAGINYNFSEQAVAVQQGQAAPIGFWQNRKGQALISSLNGGSTATDLGNWLAATLPGAFGQLAGQTNAQVADYYVALFRAKGGKLEAHMMATALSTYVTTESLAGLVGEAYGFTISTYGLAFAVYNVGTSGAAFGVENGTTLTVIDILRAADAQTINGLLYGGDKTLRNLALIVFSDINSDGSI